MEAKLSNFGINRTSIWKTISVETASGTSLAIHLAEVAEAVAWVVYATGRLSHTESYRVTNQLPLSYEMVSEHLGCWDTQCGTAGPWYTGVPNTSCLCPSSSKPIQSCKTSKTTLASQRQGLVSSAGWLTLKHHLIQARRSYKRDTGKAYS